MGDVTIPPNSGFREGRGYVATFDCVPYHGDRENAKTSSEDRDNARVMYPFRPSRGPQEGKGYVSTFDFGPYYGDSDNTGVS